MNTPRAQGVTCVSSPCPAPVEAPEHPAAFSGACMGKGKIAHCLSIPDGTAMTAPTRNRKRARSRGAGNGDTRKGNSKGNGNEKRDRRRPDKRGRIRLSGHHSIFDRFATVATHAAGSPWTFSGAVAIVVVWAALGPFVGYSEVWQLVINTSTTIITFLMVFLIQRSQNKDSAAIHLKLNELLASDRNASNRLVAVEDLDEDDLRRLAAFYERLAELAERERGIKETHSLDEADASHARKRR